MPTFMPKPKSMCPGASCPGCSSAQCYAEGGMAEDRKKMSGHSGLVRTDTESNQNQKGVNQHGYKGSSGGISEAGARLRDYGSKPENQKGSYAKSNAAAVKEIHHKTLAEQRSMKKPNLYAEGGDVYDKTHRRDNEKGINKASIRSPGTSEAGAALHPAFSVHEDIDKDVAKRRHHKVLGEMRAMKKPKLYAQGGEVSQQDKVDVLRAQDKDPEFMKAQAEKLGLTKYEAKGGEIDSDGDEELHHAIGSELLDALEKKDKKGIMSALTAAIMQCMGDES